MYIEKYNTRLVIFVTISLLVISISARSSRKHYQSDADRDVYEKSKKTHCQGAFDWIGIPLITLSVLAILYLAIMLAAYFWTWWAEKEDQTLDEEANGGSRRMANSREVPVPMEWKLEIDLIMETLENSTVHDTELGQSTIGSHIGLETFTQRNNYSLPAIDEKVSVVVIKPSTSTISHNTSPNPTEKGCLEKPQNSTSP